MKNLNRKTKWQLATYILKQNNVIRKSYNEYLFDNESMREAAIIEDFQKQLKKKDLVQMAGSLIVNV